MSFRPSFCRPTVCRPNIVFAKCHVGQMSYRRNFMSAKFLSAKCVGEISCWPNVCRPNVVLANVHVSQISSRRNIKSAKCLSAKCRVGQILCRPNVVSAKCLSANCRSTVRTFEYFDTIPPSVAPIRQKILLSKTSSFGRKKISMLFDAIKSTFEIF